MTDGDGVDRHVFLIFGEYRGDLWELSRKQHVWLMNTPANDVAARRVWDAGSEDDTPLRGVSTFVCDEATVAEVHEMLVTIAEHHDGWAVIHVRGMPMDGVTDEAVSDVLGFACSVQPEDGGFAVLRVDD